MRASKATAVLWVCLGIYAAHSSAQNVTVRLVDTKRHPLAGVAVSVVLTYNKDEPKPVGLQHPGLLRSNKNGQVVLRLPQPAPGHVWLKAQLDESRWHCVCFESIVPEKLMQAGVIVQEGPRDELALVPSPGEVVFVARRLSVWERLLNPLVKQ